MVIQIPNMPFCSGYFVCWSWSMFQKITDLLLFLQGWRPFEYQRAPICCCFFTDHDHSNAKTHRFVALFCISWIFCKICKLHSSLSVALFLQRFPIRFLFFGNPYVKLAGIWLIWYLYFDLYLIQGWSTCYEESPPRIWSSWTNFSLLMGSRRTLQPPHC